MTETRKLRVFLCHSSQDKPIVRELYQRLIDEGSIDPWFDEEKLLPGQDWDIEIQKAVRTTEAVIVCLSTNSVDSEGYIQQEIRLVLSAAGNRPENTIFLIPIRLNDCTVPMRLELQHYVDFFPIDRKEWAYSRLFQSLGVRLKQLLNKEEEQALGRLIEKSSLEAEIQLLKNVAEREAEDAAEKLRLVDELQKKLSIEDLEFVKIPAGKFQMGNNHDKYSFPRDDVNIPYDYWIGRFPITNAQYFEFLLENEISLSELALEFHTGLLIKALIYRVKLNRFLNSPLSEKNLLPVSGMSFVKAQEFTQWLNKKYKDRLPEGYKFCLPSEAEWEKAARGSEDNRDYPWGDRFDSAKCNAGEPQKGKTNVGLYSKNGGDSPYQVADMSGNVWEWTRSIYKDYPYKLEDYLELDVEKLTLIEYIVLRGGSWLDSGVIVQVANRSKTRPPTYIRKNVGFRVAISLDPKQQEKNSS